MPHELNLRFHVLQIKINYTETLIQLEAVKKTLKLHKT
jgi:hypothetical protein